MTDILVDRVSTLDSGYQTGDLSVYPLAKDTKETLYEVKNNAETTLAQTLTYHARYLVVKDTSKFPAKGLLRVGFELIYYDKKTATVFQNLKRGFAGSRQNHWVTGTAVDNAVTAESHNALKDALINIEKNVGVEINPETGSLNDLLKKLENRFLAPKPVFRAFPVRGAAPLTVTFQNFSGGDSIRYLWDFGDGSTSVETAPTHTYLADGVYTVKLNTMTSTGAQGIATKKEYITINDSLQEAFYYVTPLVGTIATTFSFVDQSEGDVAQRYWVFDDGTTESQLDPDIHTTIHSYAAVGTYNTTLIVVFADQSLKRLTADAIVVT